MEQLYGEFKKRVETGKLTWQRVLDEINFIKRERFSEEPIESSDSYHYFLEAYYAMILNRFPGRILDGDFVQSPCISPHEVMRRKELWSHLSQPALKVVQLILDSSPCAWRKNNIGPEIYTSAGNISRNKLYYALRKRGWTVAKIKFVFKELKKFCNELE